MHLTRTRAKKPNKSRITTSRIRVHQTGTSGRSKYRLASFRKKKLGWGRSKKLTRDKVCDTSSNCEQRAPELLLISIHNSWVPSGTFDSQYFWRDTLAGTVSYRAGGTTNKRELFYFIL